MGFINKRLIREWANSPDESEHERSFRQAIHTLLHAVATDPLLQGNMIIKGGVLLAVCYSTGRHTTDIDFSTTGLHSQEVQDELIAALEESLANAVSELGYNIDCRVQGKPRKNPAREDATAPSLAIKIAYASFGSPAHKRLSRGECPTTFSVDYSYNEPVVESEEWLIDDEENRIRAYSVHNLVAEKYRSMLQQVVRDRYRRQDVFDIWKLLNKPELDLESQENRRQILDVLRRSALARGIHVSKGGLSDPEVRRRSEQEYDQLNAEVLEELPKFSETYETVQSFYEALPWDEQ